MPHSRALLPLLALASGLFLLSALAPGNSNPPPAHAVNGVPQTLVCRLDVTPCQNQLNLLINNEVNLGLYLAASDFSSVSTPYLAGWEYHFQFTGDGLIKPAMLQGATAPVQEGRTRGLLFQGFQRLQDSFQMPAAGDGGYYVAQNWYDTKSREIDYSAVLVGPMPTTPPAQATLRRPALSPGERHLLGHIRVKGTKNGTVRLVTDANENRPSQVTTLTDSTQVDAWNVHSAEPLAVINVGGEKARLRGRVWGQTPTGGTRRVPYRSSFDLTFWSPGAVPTWLGGEATPVATFTDLEPNRNGFFTVRDLNRSIIPPGEYDLRLHGANALPTLVTDVKIDTTGESASELPLVIRVNFGPLTVGDLNGDERVDAADLAALQPAFGTDDGAPGFDPRLDLNGDGMVDGQDFSLLLASLNQVGE